MAYPDRENHIQQAQTEKVLKRYFLHLSDLHFGRVDQPVLQGLHQFLATHDIKIDHILISGDITQRARPWQFVKAAEFISGLKIPVIAIPGNHDVPLYHLLHRFFKPFHNYEKYITPVVSDYYEDDQIMICGFRSNNIYRIASGKFHDYEVDKIVRYLKNAESKFKIVICHHPLFDRISTNPNIAQMQNAILETKPHLILTGHQHHSSVRYFDKSKKEFPILINGGTSTSDRIGQEGNTMNLIYVSKEKEAQPSAEVTTFVYKKASQRFEPSTRFLQL